MSQLLLQVHNIKKFFPVRHGLLQKHIGDIKAVNDVSLQLKANESLGLVGESGCGKSTLGRTLIRLYNPTSGQIIFDGVDFSKLSAKSLRDKRQDIQMIFQDPYDSLDPRRTIAHILEQPLKVHKIGTPSQRQEKIRAIMDTVGLNPFHLNRYPHEFSGGQRQRIAVARATILEPKLIIADEPVSALDVSIQAQILNLMKDLQNKNNLSYLFISHDLSVIEYMCDTVAVMYLGQIVEIANRQSLFDHPYHPYTQALMESIPHLGKGKTKGRKILKGEVPSPLNPPTGCSFHPRCSHVKDICKKESPNLIDHKYGHNKNKEQQQENNQEHKVACWLYD